MLLCGLGCFDLVTCLIMSTKSLGSKPAPRVENPCEVKSGALPICSLAQDL